MITDNEYRRIARIFLDLMQSKYGKTIFEVKSSDKDVQSNKHDTVDNIIIERLIEAIKHDNCEFCHGEKGGVRGNENVIGGITVCDYCTVLIINMDKTRDKDKHDTFA